MGVSQSIELSKPFGDIRSWPQERYDEFLENIQHGDFEYLIEVQQAQELFNCPMDEAKEYVDAVCPNTSGLVCGNVLMVVCIALRDTQSVEDKIGTVFKLMDIEDNGEISQDEMILLLMSIGEAFTFILGLPFHRCREPVIDSVIEFGKQLYVSMGKTYTQSISKEEFVRWTKNNIFDKDAKTIDDIYTLMVPDWRSLAVDPDQPDVMKV